MFKIKIPYNNITEYKEALRKLVRVIHMQDINVTYHANIIKENTLYVYFKTYVDQVYAEELLL